MHSARFIWVKAESALYPAVQMHALHAEVMLNLKKEVESKKNAVCSQLRSSFHEFEELSLFF